MEKSLRKKLDLPFTSDAEVIDMVARFEACTWPYPRWTHRCASRRRSLLYVAVSYRGSSGTNPTSYSTLQPNLRRSLRLSRDNHNLVHAEGGSLFADNPELVSLSGAVEALAKDCDMYWLLWLLLARSAMVGRGEVRLG